jgi:hypothetical protein
MEGLRKSTKISRVGDPLENGVPTEHKSAVLDPNTVAGSRKWMFFIPKSLFPGTQPLSFLKPPLDSHPQTGINNQFSEYIRFKIVG